MIPFLQLRVGSYESTMSQRVNTHACERTWACVQRECSWKFAQSPFRAWKRYQKTVRYCQMTRLAYLLNETACLSLCAWVREWVYSALVCVNLTAQSLANLNIIVGQQICFTVELYNCPSSSAYATFNGFCGPVTLPLTYESATDSLSRWCTIKLNQCSK